jgi:hypothetical protein
MKAKVGRMVMVVFAAVTMVLAVAPVTAGDETSTLAASMSTVSQLCVGDGGGSGGG